MDEPRINEVLLRSDEQWLHFTDPQQIIIAEKLDQVIPAIQRVEDRVEQDGLYAAGFLSYESAPAFDPSHLTKPTTGFPYLWFGLYPQPRTVNLPQPEAPRRFWIGSPPPTAPPTTRQLKELKNASRTG